MKTQVLSLPYFSLRTLPTWVSITIRFFGIVAFFTLLVYLISLLLNGVDVPVETIKY